MNHHQWIASTCGGFNRQLKRKGKAMETFIGFISAFPWSWPPYQWTGCQGQLLQISQNQALFSLLGTTFGGDGRNNFGIPDLRGRQIIGMGNGQGLTPREVGQFVGYESVKLTSNNLPPHTHTVAASAAGYSGLTQLPETDWTLGAAASVSSDRTPVITPVQMYGPPNPTNPVQSAPTSSTGSGAPIPTIPPSLCLSFCIALQGIYPNRG
jgi:microcystin-dependent protein